MKEQLYTIPVTDAFSADCECPLCKMKWELEQHAIEYTLGPSYMEEDNRMLTDELGFCEKHIQELYQQKNRLGLALILSTHMKKITKELKHYSQTPAPNQKSLFRKKSAKSDLGTYVQKLTCSCFICQRINATFEQYIHTIFHLYKHEPSFSSLFERSKGFCLQHYAILFEQATSYLSKEQAAQFITMLNSIFFKNMERVEEDLNWFIDKFDYRYQNEPWKNAKDALPRSILKTHSSIASDLPL